MVKTSTAVKVEMKIIGTADLAEEAIQDATSVLRLSGSNLKD